MSASSKSDANAGGKATSDNDLAMAAAAKINKITKKSKPWGAIKPPSDWLSFDGGTPTPNKHVLPWEEVSGDEVGLHDCQKYATKFDSHTNMIVLGGHCLLIDDSGTTDHVNSLSKEAGSISEFPIVDGACV